MNFWKSAKGGGGSFSIQKFIFQILGTLNRVFFSMKLIQKINFGVQGMFFQQLYCITLISGNLVHAFHTIWPFCLLAYMQPYPLQKIAIFPKHEEGSKAVWNFSKKSSDLVARPFPNTDFDIFAVADM